MIKKYKANKSAFKGVPRPPKYIKKSVKTYHLIYDRQRFQIKNNRVILEKETNLSISIPDKILNKEIKQIEIMPKIAFFEVIFVYEDNEIYEKVAQNDNKMAIDLGLNNLATCVTNTKKLKPFFVNGRPLKSLNQYFNKKIKQNKK